MKILLVNDDGINALGINTLAKVLATKHSVTVVAPHTQKSGYSHALSFHKAITYAPYTIQKDICAYSLTGTPCDCVKFAVDVLMCDNPPDIIVSGINDYYNLGSDVVYSATVNAALEGAILGFKSIAVSIGREFADDFSYPSQFVLNNLQQLADYANTSTTCISVNFPSNKKEDIKGIAFASLGFRKFDNRYEIVENADGSGYLLLGEPILLDNAPDSDVELIKKGFITITPVIVQQTDDNVLLKIRNGGTTLCL